MLLPLYQNLGLSRDGKAGTGRAGGASGDTGDGLIGRAPRPTYALSSTGNLYIATGYLPLQRWDGLLSDTVDAGLPEPDQQVSVESGGQGLIVGTIYAAMRWVDDRGNVSNLSPIGDAYSIETQTGTITNVSSDSPIVITSANHGLVTGDGVWVEGVHGNWAANGLWTVTVIDANTFSLNDSQASGFYETSSEAVWRRGAGQLTYSNITPPPDLRVARLQILRTKDGDANTYYIDIDTDDVTATSLVSTKYDDQLGLAVPLLDIAGNDLNQIRHAEPPNYKRVAVHHQGRLFLVSDAVYDAGAVTVTNGSKTVTGIATDWVSELAGRELFLRDADYNEESYTIDAVISATELTLVEEYDGSSAPYSRYEIRPTDAERRTLYFSSAGRPESFDFTRALTFSEMKESGNLVGLMPYQSWLYVLFEHRTYRLTYQVDPDAGQTYLDTWRGCVNQHCWAVVEGTAYLMDRQGCYVHGAGGFEDISSQIRPMFQSGNTYSINWEASEGFHCVHDPAGEMIRWFVCLDGSRYPRHAICFEYRLGRWWVEEYPVPILSSTLGRIDGRHTVFVGSSGHRIYAMRSGSLDLVSSTDGTIRGTVTSSGPLSLTDSSASFPSSDEDWIGAPVRIVSGTGIGQERRIASVTATTLRVDRPWNIYPSTDSVYQVGGISWQFRTGWFRYALTEEHETRGFEIVFEPTTAASRLQFQMYEDRRTTGRGTARKFPGDRTVDGVTVDGTSVVALDTTDPTGYMRKQFDGTRASREVDPRYSRYEIEGVTNEEQHTIHEMFVEGAMQP